MTGTAQQHDASARPLELAACALIGIERRALSDAWPANKVDLWAERLERF